MVFRNLLVVICENYDHHYPVTFYTFFFTGLAGIFGVYRSSWRFLCRNFSSSLSLSLFLSLFLPPSLLLLFLYFHWFTYRFFLSSSVALLLPFPHAFFLRVLSPLIAESIHLPFPIYKGRGSRPSKGDKYFHVDL